MRYAPCVFLALSLSVLGCSESGTDDQNMASGGSAGGPSMGSGGSSMNSGGESGGEHRRGGHVGGGSMQGGQSGGGAVMRACSPKNTKPSESSPLLDRTDPRPRAGTAITMWMRIEHRIMLRPKRSCRRPSPS